MATIVQKPSDLDFPESFQDIPITKKSSKKSPQSKISVCDVMKSSTSSIIKKMEFQVPSYLQQYTDLYTAYLHSFDQIFGTCYIAEKEFFDKLEIDENTLKSFDSLSQTFRDVVFSQIDTSTQFLDTYVKMRISAIESFDKSAQVMMRVYANMLSHFNSTLENKR
jgi:virulence-associated protein VapD